MIRTTHRFPRWKHWKQQHRIGVSGLDRQHKELLDAVNALHEAFRSGKSQEEMDRIFQHLIDCSHKHFAEEEKTMRATHYPGYAAHKAEHEVLHQQLLDLQKRLKEGQEVFSVEVVYFLRHWVMHHVVEADKEYGRFLESENSGPKNQPA